MNTETNTPDILRQVMARREAAGLHVTMTRPDGSIFNYYPATEAQKWDFVERAAKQGAIACTR